MKRQDDFDALLEPAPAPAPPPAAASEHKLDGHAAHPPLGTAELRAEPSWDEFVAGWPLYRDPVVARREIPTLALLTAPIEVVRERATRALGALRDAGVECEMVDSMSTVGAGAFPTASLPSAAVALGGDAEQWGAALRSGAIAVVGRVQDGRMLLDLRTVPDDDVATLVAAVVAARG